MDMSFNRRGRPMDNSSHMSHGRAKAGNYGRWPPGVARRCNCQNRWQSTAIRRGRQMDRKLWRYAGMLMTARIANLMAGKPATLIWCGFDRKAAKLAKFCQRAKAEGRILL